MSRLVETEFHLPQLHLWTLNDEKWRKAIPPKHLQPLTLWEAGADGVMQIPPAAPTRRQKPTLEEQQLSLTFSSDRAI
jgi:hypothetical protein